MVQLAVVRPIRPCRALPVGVGGNAGGNDELLRTSPVTLRLSISVLPNPGIASSTKLPLPVVPPLKVKSV